MNTETEILAILDKTLGLHGRTATFNAHTSLLGALPELDSMSVIDVLGAIETHFGITLEDDDLDGASFETIGSLTALIKRSQAAHEQSNAASAG